MKATILRTRRLKRQPTGFFQSVHDQDIHPRKRQSQQPISNMNNFSPDYDSDSALSKYDLGQESSAQHELQAALETPARKDFEVTPDTLADIDFSYSTKETIKEWIGKAYGIDQPSPTFLNQVMAEIPSCFDVSPFTYDDVQLDDGDEYEVTVEDYSPGQDYVMTGALAQGENRTRRIACENDAIVCDEDLADAVKHMPFRLLTLKEINDMDLFTYSQSIYELPEDFQTTILGVWLSVTEIAGKDGYGDKELLGELLRRGGEPDGYMSVVYPEDLVPYIGADHEWYDEEYWEQIYDQGKIWDEVYIPSDVEDKQEVGMNAEDDFDDWW